MLQFRPPGGGPFYSPERDIAYCGLNYIAYALADLEENIKKKSDWIRYFVKELYDNNYSAFEQEMQEAIALFRQSLFLSAKRDEDLTANSEEIILQIPLRARAIIMLSVCSVFLGGTITGWRDVHTVEEREKLTPKAFYEEAIHAAGLFMKRRRKSRIRRFFEKLM